MKITFIRTPRYIWPFNSETSAFWQPLGFMCLAGQLDVSRPDWTTSIIDCPGSKIGWKTLCSSLSSEWPDVVCIGEETVSAHEGIRLANFVKQQHPDTIVIAGGVFFGNMAEYSLGSNVIDYIVHGEGEITLLELLTAIAERRDVKDVKGISYKRDGQITSTPIRHPIADMDMLPMPAWSKTPMHLYGSGAKNHPGLVSIEHSRGCTDSCSFCNLWKQMGRYSEDGQTIRPYYRSKSPDRCLEEVKKLAYEFNRYTFGWVDPTWNVDPVWTDRFSTLLLKNNIKIQQTAWLRADYVIRDEELGILEKAVRAGLCQVMIGVERPDELSLNTLNKHSNGHEITARAFEIFRRKYPDVFTIGSVIFGLWDETEKSLDMLSRYQYKIGMDYCFFIPLTPNPGTEVYEDACRRGAIEVSDYQAYNFHTPIMRTKKFTARQLEKIYFHLAYGVNSDRAAHYLKRLFSFRSKRHRKVSWSLWKYGAKIAARYMLNKFRHPYDSKPTVYSRKPVWYDL